MADMIPVEAEIEQMVADVVETYHGRLAKHGVRIKTMWHQSDEGKPLKLHGYSCQALIRKVSLRDRRCGIDAEAVLVIDPYLWGKLDEPQRIALLDHELTHLEPALHPKNPLRVLRDADGRPKLCMRLHDVEVGWFDEVRERHGSASMEAIQHAHLNERYHFTQATLPFARSAV